MLTAKKQFNLYSTLHMLTDKGIKKMKPQFIRKVELLIEMYKIIFIAFFMLYQLIQVSFF